MTEQIMARNTMFNVTNALTTAPYFPPIILGIRKLVTMNLAPLFGKTWRYRSVNSWYISEEKTLLEPLNLESPRTTHTPHPMQSPHSTQAPRSTQAPPPSASARMSAMSPPSTPTGKRGVPASSFVHTPQSATSGFTSQFEPLNLDDFDSLSLGNSPLQPSQSFSSSTINHETLPADVLELLTSLKSSSEQLTQLEFIFNSIGRAHQEAEVLKCGFNHGTAKAITWLMKNTVT